MTALEIAGGLTRAQRRLVKTASAEPHHVYDLGAREKTARALVDLGLMFQADCTLHVMPSLCFPGYGLTALGLEVRALLKDNSDANG